MVIHATNPEAGAAPSQGCFVVGRKILKAEIRFRSSRADVPLSGRTAFSLSSFLHQGFSLSSHSCSSQHSRKDSLPHCLCVDETGCLVYLRTGGSSTEVSSHLESGGSTVHAQRIWELPAPGRWRENLGDWRAADWKHLDLFKLH